MPFPSKTAYRLLSISQTLTGPRLLHSLTSLLPQSEPLDFNPKYVASSFKNWFKTKDDPLLDRIHQILSIKEDDLAPVRSSELELNRLGLKLTEGFVLQVLNHGKDVLSCLKFFDWAGRQNGYNHTRSTFYAIFKILSREKLMSLMIDFLETYRLQKRMHKVRFYDTLVVGYAVAGKPDVALKLFGGMRFQGLDLDAFAYHVFLNALVEQNCFDVVEVVFRQIKLRGLESEMTSCIRVKNFCKQGKLKEAVSYLRWVESRGGVVNDHMVGVIVDWHCKKNKYEEAHGLMEEFWGSGKGKVPLRQSYGIWTRNLVRVGKLDGALDFMRSKKLMEGYVPDVFRYNTLICKLLRENRLNDVYDLLMEMVEEKISPDKVTMNAALCFFCKAGMVDVALELYNSRSEFGLSLNSLSYNYLINTLCGDGSVDEAYLVLKDSVRQGCFPGKKASSILADALCREGKLDKMKELVLMALELNIMPSDAVCAKFISALCKARRVEEGYLVYAELSAKRKVSTKCTYLDLVRGFNKVNRGDMAARLLIEMQENGHKPSRELYRAVICCICTMKNPETHFFKLLEMQLSREEPDCQLYNFFLDGAGHAKRYDLAREVYEMMIRNGMEPNNNSKLFMMQSYLKSERIADALYFYGDLCKESEFNGKIARKLNNTMIVGLSKANKPGLGLEVLRDVREKGLFPSLECYEELVKSFCEVGNYDMVVEVIDDFLKTRRPITSFLGNILLLNSFKSRELHQAWVRAGVGAREASASGKPTLGELIGLFSGGVRFNEHIEELDEVIEQCFPLDSFTYNLLLRRRLSMKNTWDGFINLYHKMSMKGYQHNRWTYEAIVHGLLRNGRRKEAMKWADEAHRMGFDLTDSTHQFL